MEDVLLQRWLERSFGAQVNLSPKKVGQFLLHDSEIKQAGPCFGGERHEDIHIAVRPKIVAEDRAKQTKLDYQPLAAEGRNGFSVNRNP